MGIKKDLSIDYLGVKCENPFFLSSSPVGSNYEMVAKAFETGWGGVFYKTIGIFVADECSPRFDHVKKEGMPWLGFKNMEQISDKPTEVNFENMYKLKKAYPEKIMVASIMGSNEDEWRKLAKMCDEVGVDLIEGNFSCPQMTSHAMGSDVGSNPDLVRAYSKAVAETTKIPFIAKMTPNITDMTIPAIAAMEGGAKGISAINTIKSITNIDLDNMTGMPVVNGKSSISGYSGAAVKPVALRFIAQMLQHEKLKNVPMSGIGGIETWRDCLEFLLLGCRNLQVTTSVMQYGYRVVEDMSNGLMHWMDERGYDKLDDFIGMALGNVIPAEDLNRDFKILPDFNDKKCVGCGRCYISCYDAGHQAIDWNTEKRRPELNDKCVGCHLCLNVCPVANCITPGEVKWKDGRQEVEIAMKKDYE
ncbi:NAD-dependent dihydropyrimidine dehydrogenase subunit PreA [Anaerotignum propionicum]|uniref:Dihydroorotate dehydrogenase B (NAD(+)), catalytic subunit n=1 Tax=Anaerotignum propionicum DSM 1682 TaxID=991789 RepID=A0A0X8V9Y5_ANAPI|nr:NAD-dependent dihydropyrimidine dehydrogenase subunit PreA [Anaerotignum propionicum]AMJ41731.1 NAD-dependent dihydropyrimidine dehydrogenase subunit PreA [Anaerotignum propionicum DSM 1682]SHE83370.1 dihydropyrimidine dehydrogenase (NAD+) subunit PreA [[Clostridium] propionicum DSM 1682] [Anaerotignum propionicum DSM 1682]